LVGFPGVADAGGKKGPEGVGGGVHAVFPFVSSGGSKGGRNKRGGGVEIELDVQLREAGKESNHIKKKKSADSKRTIRGKRDNSLRSCSTQKRWVPVGPKDRRGGLVTQKI